MFTANRKVKVALLSIISNTTLIIFKIIALNNADSRPAADWFSVSFFLIQDT